MTVLSVNELLCFVSAQSDKSTRDHIHAIIHEFYSLDETIHAKDTLLKEFDKVLNSDLVKESRKPRQIGRSGAKQKIVKDILDIWYIIDKENAGKLQTTFVAADVNRLPALNIENENLKFLLATIVKLQHQTDLLREEASNTTNTIGVISNTLIQVNRRLDSQAQSSAVALTVPFISSPVFHFLVRHSLLTGLCRFNRLTVESKNASQRTKTFSSVPPPVPYQSRRRGEGIGGL